MTNRDLIFISDNVIFIPETVFGGRRTLGISPEARYAITMKNVKYMENIYYRLFSDAIERYCVYIERELHIARAIVDHMHRTIYGAYPNTGGT